MSGRPCVLFHAAAGPRIGFGHLVRCRSLARALGVTPTTSVRGTARTRDAARALGLDVRTLGRADLAAAAVLVVDDPSPSHARAWLARARKASTPAVSMTDGRRAPRGAVAVPGGPEHVVLDRRVRRARVARLRRRRSSASRRVLVALGGGAQVFAAVRPLVAAVRRRCPGVAIAVAAGFSRSGPLPRLQGARWIRRPQGLSRDLLRADAAVVAGGVTLYEACAIGVPSVALAVVPAQQPAIRALAARGAVVDAVSNGRVTRRAIERTAAALAGVLEHGDALASAAREAVDGRGALRVSARIRALVRGRHA